MKKEKYYLALEDYEKRVIINCLNKMRNCLISKGKYTDVVDELLIKFANAKQKKFKMIYRED